MQPRALEQSQQQDASQKQKALLRSFLNLRSPALGYLAAFVFVLLLWLIERLDTYVPQTPLFFGAPFGLVAILVALFWGTGPALAALAFSLVVLTVYVSPGILDTDVLRDILIIGPFVLLDIIVIIVVVRLERARRALLHVHHELEQAHARILLSHKQLEQTNAMKDYVLTRAAHELRTPLTTILGRTQLLIGRLAKSGQTPECWDAVENYLPVVESRALHLSRLIDSLFELTRAQSENWPEPLPFCNLSSLCLGAIEETHRQSARTITFEVPRPPIILPADDRRLTQALTHILNNASKFSEDDTAITLYVEADREYATLLIHNECPALDPEQLENLFQPFYRTPGVEYSSIEGWGLGLAISKEIVRRHRGQIWAESAPNKGLSVIIRLPLLQQKKPLAPG